MFIIVLSNSDYKGTYPQEPNFQEKIHTETVNFRILHKPPEHKKSNGQPTIGSRHDPDTVFATMFLHSFWRGPHSICYDPWFCFKCTCKAFPFGNLNNFHSFIHNKSEINE